MKKLCIVLAILMMASFAYATVQWRDGTGEETPLGSINPGTIDDAIYDNVVAPLDNFVAGGRFGCKLSYASASTVTVGAGSVVCSNTAGTVRLMARNAAATTVTWSNIDTGSEAASTTYYVYAIMSAVSDTTFTVSISTSSSAPSGVSYYQRLGYFTNDADSDISLVTDDDFIVADHNHDGTNSPILGASAISGALGAWVNKTSSYGAQQAATDGFVIATGWGSINDGVDHVYGYSDSASNPTTLRGIISTNSSTTNVIGSFCFPVKKGDYWKVVHVGSREPFAVWWIPLGA